MATDFPCMDDSPLNDGRSYRDEILYPEITKDVDKIRSEKIIFTLSPEGFLTPKK